ncbi:hypothetical protein [Salinadaptatus halalkaliphilus]|nr:hypothetical protein [Salinadaptatus halalkaliphilus]
MTGRVAPVLVTGLLATVGGAFFVTGATELYAATVPYRVTA